jgi:predicted deacylase
MIPNSFQIKDMKKPYPIEIQAPDISAWEHSNTGVPYVWSFDSGKAGPHVMVQALTHGNEFCGAIAVDWFLRQKVKPNLGRLTISFANTLAYSRWDPENPTASRYIDEDINRVWGDDVLFGPRDSAELRRARELQPFVDAADYLLDIHSMTAPCAPLMVCGVTDQGGEKSAALTKRVGIPEYLLIDTGHPAGLRMIERGGFGKPNDPRTGLLIECGQHWEKLAADVAHDTMLRFLRLFNIIDDAFVQPALRLPVSPKQRIVRVTEAVVARTTGFSFNKAYQGLDIVPKKGDIIATDADQTIRAPYDNTVLVMPSTSNVRVGSTTVRFGQFED